VRLGEAAIQRLAVHVERVGVEVRVLARLEVVEHVEVAVARERLRSEQVVGLVARVIGPAERVEAERGGIRGEQRQPEQSAAGEGSGGAEAAAHGAGS
jgi:hypothetical protein